MTSVGDGNDDPDNEQENAGTWDNRRPIDRLNNLARNLTAARRADHRVFGKVDCKAEKAKQK